MCRSVGRCLSLSYVDVATPPFTDDSGCSAEFTRMLQSHELDDMFQDDTLPRFVDEQTVATHRGRRKM
jgi:hypothetical protein